MLNVAGRHLKPFEKRFKCDRLGARERERVMEEGGGGDSVCVCVCSVCLSHYAASKCAAHSLIEFRSLRLFFSFALSLSLSICPLSQSFSICISLAHACIPHLGSG